MSRSMILKEKDDILIQDSKRNVKERDFFDRTIIA